MEGKSRSRNLFGGFVTAMRTLSILPVRGSEAENMSAALPWFPVVGIILGLIVYAVSYLVGAAFGGRWPECMAIVAVGLGAYVTRGFHLDGLSDWADGFGSIGDREKILAIMKDSRIGVFGALALIVILLAKWVAITRLFRLDAGLWIIPAYIISRTMMTELAVRLPYARPGGGTAASFVSDGKLIHRLAALGIAALSLAVIFGPFGLVALGVGWIICTWFGHSCRRRLGGITGDLLGAANEIVETVVLLLCAGFADRLASLSGWHYLTGLIR